MPVARATGKGLLGSGIRGAFVGNSRGAADLFSSVEYLSEKGQEQRASWEQEDDQGRDKHGDVPQMGPNLVNLLPRPFLARVPVLHQKPHQVLDGEDLGKNKLFVRGDQSLQEFDMLTLRANHVDHRVEE